MVQRKNIIFIISLLIYNFNNKTNEINVSNTILLYIVLIKIRSHITNYNENI